MCRANIALARPTTAAVGHSRTRWQAAHARIPLYLCVCVVAFHRLKNAIVYVFESIIALLRRGGRAFSKSTTATTTSNHLAAPVVCTCMRFFFRSLLTYNVRAITACEKVTTQELGSRVRVCVCASECLLLLWVHRKTNINS